MQEKTKTMKVPKWYTEIDKEQTAISKTMQTLIKSKERLTTKQLKKLNFKTIEKVALLSKYGTTINDYKWAKFRFENADNEFGTASTLSYNEKTKLMEIEKV